MQSVDTCNWNTLPETAKKFSLARGDVQMLIMRSLSSVRTYLLVQSMEATITIVLVSLVHTLTIFIFPFSWDVKVYWCPNQIRFNAWKTWEHQSEFSVFCPNKLTYLRVYKQHVFDKNLPSRIVVRLVHGILCPFRRVSPRRRYCMLWNSQ
jgi:hypothetical protein